MEEFRTILSCALRKHAPDLAPPICFAHKKEREKEENEDNARLETESTSKKSRNLTTLKQAAVLILLISTEN